MPIMPFMIYRSIQAAVKSSADFVTSLKVAK
jgi:hypothetical protein